MNSSEIESHLRAKQRYEDLYYLTEGWLFSTGQHFADVADQNEKAILVQNNHSNTLLGIFEPTVRAGGSAIVSKVFNSTVDTQGDSPTTGIINKQSSGPGATDVTAQVGGDNETGSFSGGDPFSSKQLGGGATPSSVSPGSVGTQGVSNLVMPGDSILISAQNDSGTGINLSIDIDWVELPEQIA